MLNAARSLTSIEKCRIQNALAKSTQKASDFLGVRDVDIIVRCQPDACDPSLPAYGYTLPDYGQLILITMDPKTEFHKAD